MGVGVGLVRGLGRTQERRARCINKDSLRHVKDVKIEMGGVCVVGVGAGCMNGGSLGHGEEVGIKREVSVVGI